MIVEVPDEVPEIDAEAGAHRTRECGLGGGPGDRQRRGNKYYSTSPSITCQSNNRCSKGWWISYSTSISKPLMFRGWPSLLLSYPSFNFVLHPVQSKIVFYLSILMEYPLNQLTTDNHPFLIFPTHAGVNYVLTKLCLSREIFLQSVT